MKAETTKPQPKHTEVVINFFTKSVIPVLLLMGGMFTYIVNYNSKLDERFTMQAMAINNLANTLKIQDTVIVSRLKNVEEQTKEQATVIDHLKTSPLFCKIFSNVR